MLIIYHASDLSDAHILAGLLESHGIPAHVGGHYLQGGVGDLAPSDLIRVYVDADKQQPALDIVSAYQGSPVSAPRPTTPAPRNNTALVLALCFSTIVLSAYLTSWL